MLMTHLTSVDLSMKETEILDSISQDPKLVTNFKKRIFPLIKDHVYLPHKSRSVTNWTNNNCESINHILKISTDWRPRKLPDLVDRLHTSVTLQMLDLRRSLYDSGNYILTSKFLKFKIPRCV